MDKEIELLSRLKNHDIKAFKKLIIEYSEDMLLLAYALLNDAVKANNLVSEILLRVWTNNELSEAEPPIHEFLYTEVRKACNSF